MRIDGLTIGAIAGALPYRRSRLVNAAATAAVAAVLAAPLSNPAAAAEAECKAMAAALLANTAVPYHSYTTTAFEYSAPVAEAERKLHMPREQQSEAIFTGTGLFLKLPTGKWVDTHLSPDALRDQIRAAVGKFSDCQRLADDKTGGGTEAVYLAQSADEHKSITTKIWVTADRGLPVRSETDIGLMEAPGQAVVHQHVSTRSTYGEVQAPKVE